MRTTFNRFTNKDNSVFEVAELELGKWYLARRRFNTKRMIDQPCRIVSGVVELNQNNHRCIQVEWTDGQQAVVFVQNVDGVDVCADSMGQASVRPITAGWLNGERAKLQKLVDQAQADLDQLAKVTV